MEIIHIIGNSVGPVDGISNYLFTQGVLGVACLVLGVVNYIQYKTSLKKDEKINQLQEGWRLDSKQTTKEVMDTMQEYSQTNRLLTEKIQVARNSREK
jgi:hypothetical protein